MILPGLPPNLFSPASSALRVLRPAGLTGRLARLFDPVIVLDPAVVPRAGVSLAWLFRFFVHHDSRLFRPLDRLSNVFGYGCLWNSSLRSSSLGSGAPSYRGLRTRRFRLISVLRAGHERVFRGGGDARYRKQDTGEGCEYDAATRSRYRFVP